MQCSLFTTCDPLCPWLCLCAGPSEKEQLDAAQSDSNASMQQHITQLEAELAQRRVDAEQLRQKLTARAEKAEGKVARLEAEADSLANQVSELQVRICRHSQALHFNSGA